MLVEAGQQQRRQILGLVGLLAHGCGGHVIQTIGQQGTDHVGVLFQPLLEGLIPAVGAPLGVGAQHKALDIVLHVHVQAVLQALVVLIAGAGTVAAAAVVVTATATGGSGAEGSRNEDVALIGHGKCGRVGDRLRRGAHRELNGHGLQGVGVIHGRSCNGHTHTLGPVHGIVRIAGEVAVALDTHRTACAALGLGTVVAGGRSLADGNRIVVCTLCPVVGVCAGAAVHAPRYLAAGEIIRAGPFAGTGHRRSTAGEIVAVCHFVLVTISPTCCFTSQRHLCACIVGEAAFGLPTCRICNAECCGNITIAGYLAGIVAILNFYSVPCYAGCG